MLVQNSVYRNTYLTDGVNKDFYFSFPILEASQVLVQTSLLTDTNTVTTVDPGQYTVTGVGQTTGGHISFTTAPPTGSRLALTLNIPITQVYQYAELDSFPAKSHEDALAKLTLICQQLKEQLERAVRLPPTSSESPETVVASIYASRDAAAASASEASNKADAAEVSAQAAANSASMAAQTVATAAAEAVSAATAQANAAHDSALAAAQSAIDAAVPVPENLVARVTDVELVAASAKAVTDLATETPAAGKIPVADSGGSINNWVGERYATCATAGAAVDKIADLADFQLVKGSRVSVIFSNPNSAASALTLNVNSTGAKAIYNERGAVSASNFSVLPAGIPIAFVYDGTVWRYKTCDVGNVVLQQVRYQTGSLASGSTAMPQTNSMPTNSQGTQFMALAITPKSSTSVLVIDVEAPVSFSADQHGAMALFVDNDVNAIAAVRFSAGSGWGIVPTLKKVVSSGSTTARTYKVRIGTRDGNMVYLNGTAGEGQYFGGIGAATITITEYAA